MRTILLALTCVLAVLAGVTLAWRGPSPLLALALAAAATLVLWASLRDLRAADPGPSMAPLAAIVIAAGLLRGLSVSPGPALQASQRGPSTMNELRIFEVVGASQPGPRCRVSLRDPRTRGIVPVSGPPEICPLAQGDKIALLAQSLRGDPLAGHPAIGRGQDALDLGRGPVLWRREVGPRSFADSLRHGYWSWVAGQRQRAWAHTRGDPAAGLAVAIGLGLQSALPPEQRRQLRAAGLGHLVAVSGMHVAVAGLWLLALARRLAAALGGSARVATVLAWLPLLAYVGLTGAPASAVRAALMLIALEAAVLVGRPAHGPTQLACAAAAMLLWRPDWALDPGFQLSVAAMGALVTAPRERGARAETQRAGFHHGLLAVLAASWRISWVCAPLSVLHFGGAPLHGLIGNAVALPLFALLMPAALAGSLGLGVVGAVALAPARLLATPILALAELLAALPALGPWPLAGCAVAALLIHRGLRRRERSPWLPPKLACALALLPALLSLRASPREPSGFTWIATGSVASRSLLVAERDDPRAACLYRPTRGPGDWIGLLEDLGVTTLTRLDARLPDPDPASDPASDPDPDPAAPRGDPQTRELGERLEQAGFVLTTGDDRCRPPDAARVREALRACQFRHGGRGRVLVREAHEQTDCWFEDRWVPMPELGPAPSRTSATTP